MNNYLIQKRAIYHVHCLKCALSPSESNEKPFEIICIIYISDVDFGYIWIDLLHCKVVAIRNWMRFAAASAHHNKSTPFRLYNQTTICVPLHTHIKQWPHRIPIDTTTTAPIEHSSSNIKPESKYRGTSDVQRQRHMHIQKSNTKNTTTK